MDDTSCSLFWPHKPFLTAVCCTNSFRTISNQFQLSLTIKNYFCRSPMHNVPWNAKISTEGVVIMPSMVNGSIGTECRSLSSFKTASSWRWSSLSRFKLALSLPSSSVTYLAYSTACQGPYAWHIAKLIVPISPNGTVAIVPISITQSGCSYA